MPFILQSITYRWLSNLGVLTSQDKNNIKKLPSNTYQIDDQLSNRFQNGQKIAIIVHELYKKINFPIPNTLNHLKTTNHTAAMLYNWNILNQALKKIGFQIDSQTKNMIINGDRDHLNMILRKLQTFYQNGKTQQSKQNHIQQSIQDSIENQKIKQLSKNNKNKLNQFENTQNNNAMKQSLSLSRSEDQPFQTKFSVKKQSSFASKLDNKQDVVPQNITSPQGDLLQYIVNELISNLKLTRKQAIALLSDNNKYLAHVLVKGIKGQFAQIEQLMQRFYQNLSYIIEKMIMQNDMCFFFLQIIKPSLLSKSQQIAQWGCRILTKVAYQLAEKQMLPLAYDWFVRQAGGLSTTILALSRHPKLNQHVVAYILQFARYNVTELFTIELKKIVGGDNLNYIKFMLIIFEQLVQSKLSAQELLSSGAIDYWVQMAMKCSESDFKNSKQLRLYSIEFLVKIWRAYPIHIEQTLDQVNQIMINIKKGILQSSQIMRFSLLEIMFNLLDEFASKKNPYASILYKKMTFLFVQNHEEQTMRQFILRNLGAIFVKFPTIPVEIFIQPFVKQVKITENKSYFLNLFDMQFIKIACQHRKLKVNSGIQLYDLLAKIKLNGYSYVQMAQQCMDILLDRFVEEELFFDYTVKLAKISLAMLYSTLKNKKQFDDQERLQAQKRAEIINFIISLIERGNQNLNQEIKNLVVHVKVQIQNRLGITHKGIQRILSYFENIQQAVNQAIQNVRDQTQSNATNKTKSTFHLPKIEPRNQMLKDKADRDETSSQQSYQTSSSKFSRQSNRQFALKDYTQFADEGQKNFMKQHNIASSNRKKPIGVNSQANMGGDFRAKKIPYNASIEKQSQMDPKVQSHINKIKQRKQQEQQKKFREKQILQRKKQILKQKIQKQLEQRNIKQGIRGGNQKDVEVKVIFQENQLNEKLFQQEDDQLYLYKNIIIEHEEQRDYQSIRMVVRKNIAFIKKIFTKYACSKVVKKDYFQEKTDMTQTDLLRFCKQKNLQKSKQPILQILKQVNNKQTKNINIETFPCFLQNLCVYLYFKQKVSSHIPMGDFMHKILKKMTVGENIKLDDEQDEQCRTLTEKVRYNPQIELPDGYKKITQRVYICNKQCSYPTKKTIKNQSYLSCFQVLNQMLFNIFKFDVLQEEVRFKQELKVVHKKQAYLPPKPMGQSKKQKEQDGPTGLLLKDTQSVPTKKKDVSVNRKNQLVNNGSVQKQNVRASSQSRAKLMNAAEKKRLQQEQQNRLKKQQEEEIRKIRQIEVKRKLQKEKQEKQKQKIIQKQSQKQKRQQQQQKKKQQQQQQKLYKQKQKQKLQKYRREQQQKQKQAHLFKQKQKQKQEQQKKQKIAKLKSKQQQKRQEEKSKIKKQRQMSEENKKKQKEDEEKKKDILRKQVLKKLQNQKEKYEIQKTIKQLTKQIFAQQSIKNVFNDNKQQLKAMFNYGKQYNEYKLNSNNSQILESKGWLTICQQFNICDVSTANKMIKMIQKQTGSTGFTYEQFEQVLFSFQTKSVLEKQMQNYGNAVKQSQKSIRQFLNKLGIPKDKLLMKDFFLNLKNQKTQKTQNRKRKQSSEQIQITNTKGQKQNWEIQQGGGEPTV